MLGKFTNLFLLHRLSLATFSSVHAFVRKLGARTARLWPSVLRELQRALALLPLIRAELDRAVAPVLLQTDASATGFGVVYIGSAPPTKWGFGPAGGLVDCEPTRLAAAASADPQTCRPAGLPGDVPTA